MREITGDQLRGHLETLVLSVLERGEAHGFEVLRRLEEEGSGLLRLKEGSLYPALYRLEEAGKIRARWEDGSVRRRGPRRRLYQLTKSGRRELGRRREGWRRFVDIIGRIVEVPP
jgi:DNA-binding PadR family transcriptional regulator